MLRRSVLLVVVVAFAIVGGALLASLAGSLAPPTDGAAWRLCSSQPDAAGTVVNLSPTEIFERFAVVSSNGTYLDVGVWRPNTTEPVPVVAIVSPYVGNNHPAIGNGFEDVAQRLHDDVLPYGFAFALASVRGTGCSEGCFSMGDSVERDDTRRIVDALGTKTWSNGKVALAGRSYEGTTPWEAVAAPSSHLATILPFEGLPDMYRFTLRNGTTYLFSSGTTAAGNVGFNVYYPLITDWGVPIPTDTRRPDPQPVPFVDQLAPNLVRTCNTEAFLALGGAKTMLDGTHDAFWDDRDVGPLIEGSHVPILTGVGLIDGTVKPDAGIDALARMAGPKRIFLGQWGHELPTVAEWRWDDIMRAWFNHTLKGVDNGIDAGPVVTYRATDFHSGHEDHSSSAWPPPEATATSFYLTDHATLDQAGQPTSSATIDTSTTLVFDAPPVTGPTLIAGIPHLVLPIVPHMPGGQIEAEIQAVSATGALIGGAPAANWAIVDLHHAQSIHRYDDVPIGSAMRVTLEFYSMARILQPGEHLRLSISTQTIRVVPTIASSDTISIGGAAGAQLILPIVGGG